MCPAAAELCEPVFERPAALVELEVAERPIQHVVWCDKPALCEVEGAHGRARSGGHLQRQRNAAFDVRLHRAGQLRIGESEDVLRVAGRQLFHARKRNGCAECARRGRPEEPEALIRGQPERNRSLDAERNAE